VITPGQRWATAAPPPVKRSPLRIPRPTRGSGSYASGGGPSAWPPKPGRAVRLGAEALMSRISLVREAVCKAVGGEFDPRARLQRPEANRIEAALS